MEVLDFIQLHLSSGFLDAVMPAITAMGDHGLLWIVLFCALLCTKKYRRAGIAVAISLLLCYLIINLGIKPAVARVRPYDVSGGAIGRLQLLIPPESDYSFPSGHTATAFAASVALVVYSRRFGVAALVLAALIGFSRLYLYVHYLSDVLIGAALGALFGYTASLFANRIPEKYLREERKT